MKYTNNPEIPSYLKIVLGKRKIYYIIPELENKTVISNKVGIELSKIGLTCQDWYDKHALGINNKSSRPKCPYCGKDRLFIAFYAGYSPTCGDKECIRKEYTRVQNKSREENPERWRKQCNTSKKIFNLIKLEWEKNKNKGIKYTDFLKEFWNKWRNDNNRVPIEEYKTVRHKNKVERIENKRKQLELRKGLVRRGKFFGIKTKMYSRDDNKIVGFDSTWERSYFIYSLNNVNIKSIRRTNVSPKAIWYKLPDNSDHRYIPDFVVEYFDGGVEIIEIKPSILTQLDINKYKFSAAIEVCKELGFNYKVLTEVELKELGVLDSNCNPIYM